MLRIISREVTCLHLTGGSEMTAVCQQVSAQLSDNKHYYTFYSAATVKPDQLLQGEFCVTVRVRPRPPRSHFKDRAVPYMLHFTLLFPSV